MQGFRKGSFDVLVATDIAARGIDVQGVSHVINFDVPNTPEAYTHRIGRTGRAEREGQAVTFATREDAAWLRATERKLGAPIQRLKVRGFEEERIDTRGSGGGSRSNGPNGRRGGNGGARGASRGSEGARSRSRGSKSGRPAGASSGRPRRRQR